MATKSTIKEIKAPEGYYLTQVAEVGDDRQYLTAIKGVNINADNWRYADEAEKIAFEEEQKAKAEAEQKQTEL